MSDNFKLPDELMGGAVKVIRPTDLRNRVGLYMMEERGVKMGRNVEPGDVQDMIVEFAQREIERTQANTERFASPSPATAPATPREIPWSEWAQKHMTALRNAIFATVPEEEKNANMGNDALVAWPAKLAERLRIAQTGEYNGQGWVRPKRPKIICLCGSTRFIEQFAIQTWELELQGHIVLGCTLLPSWYCPVRDHFAESLGVKEQRDNHHLQKIDIADEVLVLNIGGYIGESTKREIEYAAKIGKTINYLEPLPAPPDGQGAEKEKA